MLNLENRYNRYMHRDQNKTTTSPETLLLECWNFIEMGIQSRKSNYHIMSLHYIADGHPKSINLIPRKLNKASHQINCHTDYRSQKIKHLQKNPAVCGLFWCRDNKVQIVIEGTINILHKTEATKAIWDNMRHMSKICYCSDINPSTKTSSLSTGFTKKGWEQRNQVAETVTPYNNFSVLQMSINSLERLHLSANGHSKIRFHLNKQSNAWTHQWLTP